MAIMQEQCLKKYQHTIIIGDLNARVAKLQELNNNELNLTYSQNPDTTTNENGKELLSFCKNHNIVPVNHMKHHNVTCEGGYTYKQKNNWISQLDWALCSINMLSHIKKFRIIQDQNLPTDHAAIALSLSNLQRPAAHIRNCAEQLGAYTFLQQTRARCIKPPIPFLRVNQQQFRNKLPSLQELSNITEGTNIEEICTKVADIMYNTINETQKKRTCQKTNSPMNATQRWNNIISLQDPKAIWTAINWRGEIARDDISNNETPSDEEFCEHFENLLNPTDRSEDQEFIPNYEKYIPILDDPIQPREVTECIHKLKTAKAPGPDGIPPGIFKSLPNEWISLLVFIYNSVFSQDYPMTWAVA
jgi:hypothetical protein